MQKIKRLALTSLVLGAMAITATAQDTIMKKSLYDRLGGLPAIKAVIDDFTGRVAADNRINKKFGKSDIPRVKLHLVEQVCAATGGPCAYTGLDMKKAHKNMKVTEGEFGALVEDLVATLDKFNVPQAEKDELLGILGPLKSQIVEVNSADTGTRLPANFKPARKLSKKRVAAGPMMKKM
ncbi:MAG: group 1 truncated hemoglobin [bacterium]